MSRLAMSCALVPMLPIAVVESSLLCQLKQIVVPRRGRLNEPRPVRLGLPTSNRPRRQSWRA